MDFLTFWHTLQKETASGKKFLTLSRKKPFTATFENGYLIIKPSKIPVYERKISQKEFNTIWSKASKLSPSERFSGKNYHDDTFHSSYILTIMKSIIGEKQISQ